MAIFYDKQPRRDPFHDGQVRYYPIAKMTSMAGEREVAEIMCQDTTLNPAEARLAIELLRKAVLRLLREGRSVRLGDWASFYTTLTSDGADSPEQCTWRSVKAIRPRCYFTPRFTAELQGTELRDIEAWLNENKRDTD